MQLESLTPNLMVKDVNATLAYYTETLGFELLQTVPEEGAFEWGFVRSGKVMLMFQQEASIKAEYKVLEKYSEGGALTLYIRVGDIEKWHGEIKGKTEVISPLHKTFYGATEFAIKDPNGFILTFSDILE